jgi:hypothetical protein
MHQPLQAISAVLGQEPVKGEALEVKAISYHQVVIYGVVPFFNDGKLDSIHIQKLVRNVRIAKDPIAMVPRLPS